MPQVISLQVKWNDHSHPILIGSNLLPHSLLNHPLLKKSDSSIFIVADIHVKPLAEKIIHSLGKRCAQTFFLPGGERTKSLATLNQLYQRAAHARLDRQSFVIAIGGGVIGDVVGVFAATYLRGLRIIHVPTTLIAQVDSAIGGKTGINLPSGKNLVGAFHQPSLVLVDPKILNTLPEREFRAGLAEVIKYGVITDSILFKRLEQNLDKILQRDSRELAWLIHRCCAIKARIVSRDAYETSGLRATLNFGHTIGHGIEAASKYSMLHGEAVALGMSAAAYLSERILNLKSSSAQRIRNIIQRAGLPLKMKRLPPIEKILAAMKLDKKISQGKIRFVLADRIGSTQAGIPLPQPKIVQAIRSLK